MGKSKSTKEDTVSVEVEIQVTATHVGSIEVPSGVLDEDRDVDYDALRAYIGEVGRASFDLDETSEEWDVESAKVSK